jgi:hypothetical protein
MAGAPAKRMLAAVSATSHHGQWSRASFKISGEEGRFFEILGWQPGSMMHLRALVTR